MSLHLQFSVKFFYSYGYHGKTKFIKQHLYWFHTRFSVPNPPIEPAPVMEPAPAIPKQMSQCRNRGCRKAWNHTPIPIPESESHHPYYVLPLQVLILFLASLLYLPDPPFYRRREPPGL